MKTLKPLSLLASALFGTPAFAVNPPIFDPQNYVAQTFVTTIDAATYNGATGTITFNDHGYSDYVNDYMAAGADVFQVGAGFDANNVGQVQNVVTNDPDWLTSDPTKTVRFDGFSTPDAYPTGSAPNANMDGTVNFFKWGYTTVGGSTFNNMQIDTAGNYHVEKSDMNFQLYDTFQYNNGVDPIYEHDTYINFKPYAISDGKGWCGSVLGSSPTAVEPMAGQLTFDFAMDVYLDDTSTGTPATQYIQDFVMRSYGDYEVSVKTSGGFTQKFTGSAVVNNTNPVTGEVDPNYAGEVSFLGAGVVPLGVWVLNDNTADVQIVDEGTEGATWHANQYAGYAFMLRADGTRTLISSTADWSDYTSVASIPEPSTYAMMAIGLGLVGAAVRRRRMRA